MRAKYLDSPLLEEVALKIVFLRCDCSEAESALIAWGDREILAVFNWELSKLLEAFLGQERDYLCRVG